MPYCVKNPRGVVVCVTVAECSIHFCHIAQHKHSCVHLAKERETFVLFCIAYQLCCMLASAAATLCSRSFQLQTPCCWCMQFVYVASPCAYKLCCVKVLPTGTPFACQRSKQYALSVVLWFLCSSDYTGMLAIELFCLRSLKPRYLFTALLGGDT
jgi:hypothetical protein